MRGERVPSRARDAGDPILLRDRVLVHRDDRQFSRLLVPFYGTKAKPSKTVRLSRAEGEARALDAPRA
jgi:hypothetical protein